MHNYNSQRKGKKSECLCSNLASGCPHISNLSIPFLSFILCCWIFFAAENFHLTLQYLKTMIKRKLLLSKCTLPFFYLFFFFLFFGWLWLYPCIFFNIFLIPSSISIWRLLVTTYIESCLADYLSSHFFCVSSFPW